MVISVSPMRAIPLKSGGSSDVKEAFGGRRDHTVKSKALGSCEKKEAWKTQDGCAGEFDL